MQACTIIPISEIVRRKKDLDLVGTSHPLLPTVIHCLEDRDTKRPSADELCDRLASLQREYAKSIEQQKLAYARISKSNSKKGYSDSENSSGTS